jgi:hypothetical protein
VGNAERMATLTNPKTETVKALVSDAMERNCLHPFPFGRETSRERHPNIESKERKKESKKKKEKRKKNRSNNETPENGVEVGTENELMKTKQLSESRKKRKTVEAKDLPSDKQSDGQWVNKSVKLETRENGVKVGALENNGSRTKDGAKIRRKTETPTEDPPFSDEQIHGPHIDGFKSEQEDLLESVESDRKAVKVERVVQPFDNRRDGSAGEGIIDLTDSGDDTASVGSVDASDSRCMSAGRETAPESSTESNTMYDLIEL